jgi:hypothetical protein
MNAREIMKGLYQEDRLRRDREKAVVNLQNYKSKLVVLPGNQNMQNTLARQYINKIKRSIDPVTVLKEYKINAQGIVNTAPKRQKARNVINRMKGLVVKRTTRATDVINRMKGLVTKRREAEEAKIRAKRAAFNNRVRRVLAQKRRHRQQRMSNFAMNHVIAQENRRKRVEAARMKMNNFMTPARLNKLAGNNAALERLLNMAKRYSKNLNSSENPNKTAQDFILEARRITNSIPKRVANNGNNYGLNLLYNNEVHPLPLSNLQPLPLQRSMSITPMPASNNGSRPNNVAPPRPRGLTRLNALLHMSSKENGNNRGVTIKKKPRTTWW